MTIINEAPWDRALRILLGVIMLTAGWLGHSHHVLDVALRVLGWVPLVTGLVGWCPLYASLRWSTRRAPRSAS